MSKPPVSTQDTISSPPSAEQMYPAPVKLDRDPVGHNRAALNLPTPNPTQRDPRHGNPFGGGRATS